MARQGAGTLTASYNRAARAALPLLAFFAAGVSLAAQKLEPPVFKTGVTLVAVPVFVIDKAGKSVAGLAKEDFEVEDGGKRVPIVAFRAVDVDAAVTTQSEAERAELPVAIQAEAPRQFLLLFDLRYSPIEGIVKGRKAGMAFVRDALAPGDLVAVATISRRGLNVLTHFTSDHAYVSRAIAGLGLVSPLSTDALGLAGDSFAGGSGTMADSELAALDSLMKDAQETFYRQDVSGYIDDLQTLVRILSPLRGRKQIVLLSAGFAESSWQSPVSSARLSTEGVPLMAKMEELFRKAGQSDVVIHTISLDGIDNVIGALNTRNIDSAGVPQFGKDPSAVDSVFKKGTGRGTLTALAANTGGRFIMPTNDFGKALGEVDQISRHSYVIAFEAVEPGKSNKPRSLKIRVRGAGLSVSHRPSYTPTPAKSATDPDAIKLQAAEAISKGLNGGPLSLHLTTLPYRDGAGQQSLHAVLQINGPALAEAAKGPQMAVQVYGYLMEQGRVLDSLALNTAVDLSKFGTQVRSSGIRVVTAFPVSPGSMDLRFFVRAGAPGETGSIQRNVAAPVFNAGELTLSVPMFTLSIQGKVVVPFQPQNRARIEIPFRLDSTPFVPDASVTLTPGRPREVCVFVWRDHTGGPPPLEVTGEVNRTGEGALPLRFEGAPRVVTDTDGVDRYVINVEAPRGSAGAYTLRLIFRDPATGHTARTETEITVEK